MEYSSTGALCRMVESAEYQAVMQYKLDGLQDTHTYLTTKIL